MAAVKFGTRRRIIDGGSISSSNEIVLGINSSSSSDDGTTMRNSIRSSTRTRRQFVTALVGPHPPCHYLDFQEGWRRLVGSERTLGRLIRDDPIQLDKRGNGIRNTYSRSMASSSSPPSSSTT
eukprot:CAMPEP_0113503526 /NCGR_PEP_ID=MMETSP0014_2-20120614/34205_1 /TAXON_ID=2857 /ORGANISM="Nitzschia sp." /LENGTH=122 /DNA_ID=CAMNT_0000398527 /DNA_START=32 /DNA_END=397 /DNA_ORIENTATION=- /assembly_acc=CAM_ASM_000159